MRQFIETLAFDTEGSGLYPITSELDTWTAARTRSSGLLTLLCQHTSASLTIQENADPDVRRDLQDAFAELAPEGGPERYRHHHEGRDDMAAHIRTVLSGVHLAIPIADGQMALGTWQDVYLWEHRRRHHRRLIALHLLTE